LLRQGTVYPETSPINNCYHTPMSNKTGFRRNNNDGGRRKRPELDVIIEDVQAEDAEERIATAFEMLLGDITSDGHPTLPTEPGPGTQLPLF